MEFSVHHTVLGDCKLSDEHPKGSAGSPVIVGPDGKVYGPKDPEVRNGNMYPEASTSYTQDYLDFVRKFNARL